MTITQALLGFAVLAALLTIVPGLDTALVLRTSLIRSRAEGLAVTAGIQLGTLIWGAAAALGASALLAVSESAYRIVSLLGAGYLVWLGVSLLVRSFRPSKATSTEVMPRRRGLLSAAGTGLLTNLLNPKVGVFYLATIPQFVPVGVNPLPMGLLLATVHCLFGTVWLSAIVFGGAALGRRLRNSAVLRWVDRVTGGVLVAMGVRLAFEARA